MTPLVKRAATTPVDTGRRERRDKEDLVSMALLVSTKSAGRLRLKHYRDRPTGINEALSVPGLELQKQCDLAQPALKHAQRRIQRRAETRVPTQHHGVVRHVEQLERRPEFEPLDPE